MAPGLLVVAVVLLTMLPLPAKAHSIPAGGGAGLEGHACAHDDDVTVAHLYHHGMDHTTPQRYGGGSNGAADGAGMTSEPQRRGFRTMTTVAGLRIAISALDVFDNSRVCTAVGSFVPDAKGGTINCTDAADLMTPTKAEMLVRQIIPLALDMFRSRLQVVPIAGNLSVRDTSVCPYFTVPPSHVSAGVPDADMVLYVSATKNAGSTVAWAGYCQLDQANRPVVGRMNFGSRYIDNASSRILDQTVRVVAHELGHALGFSYTYLSNYFPALVADDVPLRGKTTSVMRGPATVAAGQAFFGCPSLTGVELEDEINVTSRSHWERRNHFEDVMSPIVGDYMWISNITLSFFKDLGFYFPILTLAETPAYAKGLGCSFLTEKCMSTSNPGFGTPYGSTFCNETTNADVCTRHHLSIGRCPTKNHTTMLLPYFQYYAGRPYFGGSELAADFCPIVTSWSNRYCNDSTSSANDDNKGIYYGPGGRCVETYQLRKSGQSYYAGLRPTCVRLRCVDGARIQFKLADLDWADCPLDGRAANIFAPSGFLGNLTCPAAADVCVSSDLYYASATTTTTTTPSTTAALQSTIATTLLSTTTTPPTTTTTTVVPQPSPTPTTIDTSVGDGACENLDSSMDGGLVGWFTDDVPWGCGEPFDCFLEFCSCVDGPLSSTCSPFGSSLTPSALSRCLERRVECTLDAALHARWAANATCREWGGAIVHAYAGLYANRSARSNLTDACVHGMCAVTALGGSAVAPIAARVNYSHVCGWSTYAFPAPVAQGEVPGCVASSRSYFNDIPVGAACPGPTACLATLCSCTSGAWNASTFRCTPPTTTTLPTVAVAKACLATAVSCVLNSALSLYIPGASPLDQRTCLSWSVPIAEDYSTYYSSQTQGQRTATLLWKACNHTVCKTLFNDYGGAASTATDFSSICTFDGVSARPTFQPYNACPYACPDGTCATGLEACGCTANASLSGIQVVFPRNFSGPSNASSPSLLSYDVTKTLAVVAYAGYASNGTNCSGFDYTTVVVYRWTLATSGGTTVAAKNTSSFSVAAGSGVLQVGVQYVLTLRVLGLRDTHVVTRSWSFVGIAPAPTVSITGGGASLRVPNTRSIVIAAKITDAITTTPSYAWTCTAVSSGSCIALTNTTLTSLTIAAGVTAGTYNITFTYRSMYSSSVLLTVVDGDVPYARIVLSGTRLQVAPVSVYLSTQVVSMAAVVAYSGGNVTYAWTANNNATVLATTQALSIAASALLPSTLDAIAAGTPVENVLTLTVTAVSSSTIYGEATVAVVVVAPIVLGLSAQRNAGGGTSVVALADKMRLAPTATTAGGSGGSVVLNTAPYGATLAYAFVFYDRVGDRDVRVGLQVAPVADGSGAYTATTPLYSDGTLASKATIVSVTLRIGGIVAAVANATMTIARPSDIGAAATQTLALLSSITDASSAVSAATTLRSLMAQSTNETLVRQLASAALGLLLSSVTDGGSLAPEEQVAVLGTIARALGTVEATSKRTESKRMEQLILSAIRGSNFDSGNADVVLTVVRSMDAQTGGQTSMALALALSGDANQPLGVIKMVQIAGYIVAARREAASSLNGLQVSDASGSGLQLPSSGFSLPGVGDDDVVGIAWTVLTSTPFGDGTAASPSTSIVSFDISLGGNALSVSGLTTELVIVLPTSEGSSCAYYSVADQRWKQDGLRTVLNPVTQRLECHSTHLTAFAGFASSAAKGCVSLAVLLLVLAAHAML